MRCCCTQKHAPLASGSGNQFACKQEEPNELIVSNGKGSPETWEETAGELQDAAKYLIGSVGSNRKNVRGWRGRQEKMEITVEGKELPEFERKWL